MVQIIAGEMGKGKTKEMLRMVNDDVLHTEGSIVYLDKTNKHMYELSNRVRLINVKDYLTGGCDEFIGFLCGIVSQDNDLEKVYVDSLLKVACVEEENLPSFLEKLDWISSRFSIDMILSISLDNTKIPDSFQQKVIISL